MNRTEKKLRGIAQIAKYIETGEIVIENTRNVTIAVVDFIREYDNQPQYDADKNEQLFNLVCKTLSTDAHPWGGHRAAGYFWYAEKDYDSAPFEAVLRDQLGPAYY